MTLAATTPAFKLAQDVTPAPCGEQRDEHGRRIALSFESNTVRPVAPPADCWLVALDGSGHSLRALETAMRLATESGANALDLVTVHHWLSTEAAETELSLRSWATTAEARAHLEARGFGWRLHALMGEPAVRIVEQAAALGSRGIVIGARGLTAFDGLLMGSVAQQVLHTARGAVLVVRGSESSKEWTPC